MPDSRRLAVGEGSVIRIYPIDRALRDRDPLQLEREMEARAGRRLVGFELQAAPDAP